MLLENARFFVGLNGFQYYQYCSRCSFQHKHKKYTDSGTRTAYTFERDKGRGAGVLFTTKFIWNRKKKGK